MKELVKIFKALSDPARIKIVKLLEKKDMCVCELKEALGIGQSNVSHHLRILKEAGLVCDFKDGLWVNYTLSREKGSDEGKVLKMMSGLINDSEDIKNYLKKAKTADRERICCKSNSAKSSCSKNK